MSLVIVSLSSGVIERASKFSRICFGFEDFGIGMTPRSARTFEGTALRCLTNVESQHKFNWTGFELASQLGELRIIAQMLLILFYSRFANGMES